MAELKDSFESQVEIERVQVRVLKDELLIAKAHESKLEEELHASMEEICD